MSSGKTQKYKYETNTGNEVKAFVTTTSTNTVNGVPNTVSALSVSSANSGFYPVGTLYKNTVTDEDGNSVVQFQNGRGQTILIRKNDGTQNIDTYYVFNEYNQQAFIIPPKAVKQIEQSNNTVTDAVLNELCYQYRYDGQDREVEKKLPNKGWEYSVYDKQDRLVLTQDGLLRTVNNNFNSKGWIFNKYDESGRIVYTGFYPNSDTRQAIQNQVNTITTSSLNNEQRITNPIVLSGTNLYYRNLAFPSAGITLLTVNYYDTYPQEAPAIPTTILDQYVLPQTLDANNDASTNGVLTASYVKNIEDNNWTKAYDYYDSMGRLISTNTINHLGGYTKTETEFDFAGAPQKKNTYHLRKQGETGVTIQERFVYDNQNRLLQHFHQVDSQPEELLAENSYNDLSQLINKKVGSVSGSAPLQSIDYDYNIRGWLTDVNKNQMSISDLNGKLFSYKIKYTNRDGIENPDPVQFSGKNVLPKYNGNIAEVDWRAIETIGVNPSLTPKRYGYSYDRLDRLTAGFYQNPNNPYSKENTESLSYDPNGNISNLHRTSVMEYGSNTATVIDNLDYTYLGNQAVKIQDNSGNSTGYEGTAGNPIEYDVNGNMKNMIDKSIAGIGYNYLNLPSSVNINFGQLTTDIATKYRADGIKVRKETTKTSIGIGGTTSSKEITDYLDGFQYYNLAGGSDGGGSESRMSRAFEPQAFTPIEISDPTIQPIGDAWTGTLTPSKTPDLQFFPTEEGFYDYIKNQYIYQYKDHLGNVRVSFARNSAGVLTIVDSNDYYPFGMNHLKSGNAYFGGGSYKNYKMQGQELQETGFYAYKWRNYMPDVGRFFNVDPLSEEYAYQSHYNFSENRVIDNVELEGLEGEDFRFRMAMKQKGGVQARAEREDQEANSGAFMAVIRTVTPIEEIYTLASGRDLDGNPASRKEAVKLLALNFIPEVKAEAKAASVVLKAETKAEAKATAKAEAKSTIKAGRSGKQARLRQLANEPKLGKADKGWLKSEINKVANGKRPSIRNPPGKDLAHERGREAAKGYSYEHSHLQNRKDHRNQHKYDNGGRKNKERPIVQ
ncbi:MAG: polymorphic toxin type 8 domain-containing protein [Chryseobacterium sp.]|uniref:polymorphic toxin type 8 domain-containing protein n=1 Tax=Chryseobacterium sp. TaxID=1871047 RepID=UPI0025C2C41B|nr:polymorphic toxin type 8 domain-containing protein [Chryseobacterium sp.]MCJ7933150.1 polymorphic toxin type 8 domain-containing protein [Chryseobacterium sp.]